MSSRKARRVLAGALALGVVAAWSQDLASATTAETIPPTDSTTPTSQATAEVPPQFADGDVRIALVAQLSAGDYFEQWRAGADCIAVRGFARKFCTITSCT